MSFLTRNIALNTLEDSLKEFESRSIGSEQEFVVVSTDKRSLGRAANKKKIRNYLTECAQELGFDICLHPTTQKFMSAQSPNSKITLSPKFGHSTIGIDISPQDNLFQIEEEHLQVLQTLCTVADEHKLNLLGYGIHPLTPASSSMIHSSPKQHQVLKKRYGEPISKKAVTAQSRWNIRVDKKEAVLAYNTFNALAPILITLFGNSPIRNNDYRFEKETSAKCIDEAIHLKSDRLRKGIAPRIRSLGEFVDRLFSFEPLLSYQDGELWGFQSNLPFKEYVEKGRAIGYREEPEDNTRNKILNPTLKDFEIHQEFYWPSARLTPEGTIQIRCVSQQPLEHFMAPAALCYGILENLESIHEIFGEYSFTQIKRAREQAITQGFEARYSRKLIVTLAKEIVQLAREGLPPSQQHYIDCLDERMDSRRSPADNAIDSFLEGGVKALCKTISIKPDDIHKYIESNQVYF